MTPRSLVLGLGLATLAAYWVASQLIGRMKKVKIHPASWEPADILETVEHFDFNGVWFDRSEHFKDTIQNFQHNNGTAHVQFAVEKAELSLLKLAKVPLGNGTSYWLDIRLNDGFTSMQNKFLFRLKLGSPGAAPSEVTVQRKRLVGGRVRQEECALNITLGVNKDRAQKTENLEDLGFTFLVRSDSPSCEMDLRVVFKYNSASSNQSLCRFLAFGLLLGLYEMALLLYMTYQVDNHDHLCKSQGIIFWTSVGMFNCLFCFINISGSAENTEKLLYFFINSMVNFVNFAIVILRILHRVGKVQLNSIMSERVS